MERGLMMNRIFRIEFRRGFYSVGFYLSILLLAAAGWLGIGDILEYLTEVEYIQGGIRFTEITYQALCSEAYTLLVPVACTLAMSAAYVEDQQSGTLHYILLRTTKSRYRWSKVANCAIFGALTVAGSILILLAISFVRCPIGSAEAWRLNAVGTTYFLYLLRRVLVLCLNGSLYALLGGMIASFANNRYMAYAAPFIFYYVISTLLDAYLSGLRLANPKEWMLERTASPIAILAVLAVVNIVAAIGYSKAVERGWRYD